MTMSYGTGILKRFPLHIHNYTY